MAYLPKPQDNPLQFTDSEILFDKVSWIRLNQFLTDPEVKILASGRDSNNYGEFRFVTIRKTERAFTFYGHGYHEYRESYFVGSWSFYTSSVTYGSGARAALPKSPVLSELSQEHIEYLALEKQAPQPSQEADLYSIIADLTDDDGALSELDYI